MDQWEPEFWQRSRVFAPLAPALAAFRGAQGWPGVEEYDALAQQLGLVTARGIPLRFVPAAPKPRRRRRRGAPAAEGPTDAGAASATAAGTPSYEARIDAEGVVATRPRSWHDFFNFLAWAAYPRTKAALNRRQVEATVGKGRTREQDRLAMLDEGGILLARGTPLVLGHALFESIMHGNPDVQGMAVDVDASPADADSALAQLVASGHFLRAERFPVLSLRELL